MLTSYKLTGMIMCPIENVPIATLITVQANGGTIMAEDLLQICRTVASAPILQEDFTKKLQSTLSAPSKGSVSVTTVGLHAGVEVTCTT
jgi:hypothetical protein